MGLRLRLTLAALCACVAGACAPTQDQASAEGESAKSHKSAKRAIRVPRSPQGAKVRSASGQSWVAGDTASLSHQFKSAIKFGAAGRTLGQAHADLTLQGFRCAASGRGGQVRMECDKSMIVDACRLSWSVRLEADNARVENVSGGGFSRHCGS